MRGERPDGGSFIRFQQPDAMFEPTERGAENQIFATGKINRCFNFSFRPFGRMNRRKNLSKRCFDFVFTSVGFPDGGKRWLGRCFWKIRRLFAVSFSGFGKVICLVLAG